MVFQCVAHYSYSYIHLVCSVVTTNHNIEMAFYCLQTAGPTRRPHICHDMISYFYGICNVFPAHFIAKLVKLR